jgi:RNA polymerase sigma factor (sigma-70 family)
LLKGLRVASVQLIDNRETEAALPDDEPDKLLHAAFVAGDESAFDRLVERHHERVARLAYRLLGWRGDVDDVVQDVFLAALKQLHRFRSQSSLSTWLTTITLNTCRTHRRKQLVRLRWWTRQRDTNHQRSSEIEPFKDEVSEQVRSAVQSLPAKDREVIVLFYLEDRTSAEIAKLLNVSVNAVDLRLFRARERLRPMLKDWVEA